MHGARGAYDGIYRAGLNAFGTADAVWFIDHCQHTNRLLRTFVTVNRLRIDVQQGGNLQHHRFAARRTAVNFLSAVTYRLCVRATAGIAALPTLALRQQLINFLNDRIVLNREAARGVTENDAK